MGLFDWLKANKPLKDGHRWWEGKSGIYQKPLTSNGRRGLTALFIKRPKNKF